MNDEKEIASHGGHGWAKYALKSLWCYSLKKRELVFLFCLPQRFLSNPPQRSLAERLQSPSFPPRTAFLCGLRAMPSHPQNRDRGPCVTKCWAKEGLASLI